MTAEEYAKLFSNASNRRLIDTVEYPRESDPLAVEAARHELQNRGLDEAIVSGLRAERVAEELRRAKRKTKVDALVNNAAAAVKEIQQTFIADPDEAKADKRQVRILVIAIGVMLLAIRERFLELWFIAEYGLDWSMAEHFLPFIFFPLTIILLWKRRRAGWFLGAAATAYSFAQVTAAGFSHWGQEPLGDPLFAFFPTPSKSEIITGMLFATGLAVGFHLRRSMVIYRITERDRWLTVLPVIVLVWWKWF